MRYVDNDLWTIDDNHEAYPHINFGDDNPKLQTILIGSMNGIDKIQEDFLLNKYGSSSSKYTNFKQNKNENQDSNPLP